jgi:hypothetical protein
MTCIDLWMDVALLKQRANLSVMEHQLLKFGNSDVLILRYPSAKVNGKSWLKKCLLTHAVPEKKSGARICPLFEA